MTKIAAAVAKYAALLVLVPPSGWMGSGARDLRAAAARLRAQVYGADGVAVPEADHRTTWDVLLVVGQDVLGAVSVSSVDGGVCRIGGWAVAERHRSRGAALCLVLAADYLAGASGAVLALATATERHGAAHMLQALDPPAFTTYTDPVWGDMAAFLFTRTHRPTVTYPEAAAVIADAWLSIPVVTT